MTANSLPLIIEPVQLMERLDDENLLIVDLSSEPGYLDGHVPGAVHVAPRELVCGIPPAPGKLPPRAQLDQLFSRLGLSPDTRVVAYDDEGGGWAGRFIWTLDVIGHADYAYLNGGIQAWKSAAGALRREPDHPTPSAVHVRLDNSPIAETEDILAHLGDPDIAIWDARSPEEFRGEKVQTGKAGHIPGAINCEWTRLMDRDRDLRIRADAADYLAGLGLTGDKRIVTHCQSHHRSGFTYLVGKSLGFDIRGYHGSWAEWGNRPDTPVER